MLKQIFGFSDGLNLDSGVKTITYATAVRWAGWGFAESLIPVLIFSFSKTYAEAGLLRSVYDIAFIVALPIVGLAADRFRASALIMLGLALYTLVGLFYFLAGLTSIATFIIIARLLNGVTYALDSVGRGTYFRRHSPSNRLASVFGYFDSITIFWWIAAALTGVWLVKFIPVHQLLFLITPTSLIALFMISRFYKSDIPAQGAADEHDNLNRAYGLAFKEIVNWDFRLRSIAMFNFFVAMIGSVVAFFLPIQAYNDGAGLSKTVLIGVMFSVPYLFGWLLGKWFDLKGLATFSYGLIALSIMLSVLAVTGNYWLQILIAFGVGIVLELISVGNNEMVTFCSEPKHFGRVGSIMSMVTNMGALLGPLMVGIIIDSQGIGLAYFLLACLAVLLAVVFLFMKKQLEYARFKTEDHLHPKVHRNVVA
jgi:MFS family permease